MDLHSIQKNIDLVKNLTGKQRWGQLKKKLSSVIPIIDAQVSTKGTNIDYSFIKLKLHERYYFSVHDINITNDLSTEHQW